LATQNQVLQLEDIFLFTTGSDSISVKSHDLQTAESYAWKLVKTTTATLNTLQLQHKLQHAQPATLGSTATLNTSQLSNTMHMARDSLAHCQHQSVELLYKVNSAE
jgi:hypothetical protein